MELYQFISKQQIGNQYVLQELLGEGAFAEVRKAVYIAQNKPYAVKIIDKKKISSNDLKVYMNECEILLYLEHPNIIEIYQIYDNTDYFYIVMEYMEGGELCNEKNLPRYQSQSQIAQIVMAITDALAFCHSKNIVHRDIKPENILWSTNDETAVLKIADFGFAKISGESLMTTACGTPMFFSPQILQGKPYDNSVDYWSVGVITYILLSGGPPFQAMDQSSMFQQIKSGKIDFPDNKWKYISCSAKDFILKVLDKNPKRRYKADKIKNHPWITSDHSLDIIFKDRTQNLKSYNFSRKVEKMQFIIEKTINDMQIQGNVFNFE